MSSSAIGRFGAISAPGEAAARSVNERARRRTMNRPFFENQWASHGVIDAEKGPKQGRNSQIQGARAFGVRQLTVARTQQKEDATVQDGHRPNQPAGQAER